MHRLDWRCSSAIVEAWKPRRRHCIGSRPTRGAGTSPPATSLTSCGPCPSTTLACCRTSRSTTWIACRGSTSGTGKSYHGCRSPANLPSTMAPAVSVLAGTAEVPAAAVDLPQLSRLLHLSAGVVRTTVVGRTRRGCSAPPGSAGGRFPFELYVAVPGGMSTCRPACTGTTRRTTPSCGSDRRRAGTPPSSSSPASHGGPAGGTGSADSGTSIGMPARCSRSSSPSRTPPVTPRRSTPGSQTRRWRRSSAPTAWTNGRSRSWRSATARPAIDADGRRGRRRGRRGARRVPTHHRRPTGRRARRARPRVGQRRARSMYQGEGRTRSRPSSSPAVPRSRMDPTGACRKARCGRPCRRDARDRVPHFVVVHDVEGLAPGVYRWPDLSRPVRAGMLRQELYRLAMEQGLARDAAFVVIGATDVAALDDREYREAQLAAGVVEGRLHLLAYASARARAG